MSNNQQFGDMPIPIHLLGQPQQNQINLIPMMIGTSQALFIKHVEKLLAERDEIIPHDEPSWRAIAKDCVEGAMALMREIVETSRKSV